MKPSPISYLGPRSTPNLFRGGSVISGLSALRSEDSNCKGGDEVGGDAGNTDAGGDAGSGGDGICGNGDDSGVSGDGGGVVKARSLSTSSLGRMVIWMAHPVDFLAVIWCNKWGQIRSELGAPSPLPLSLIGIIFGRTPPPLLILIIFPIWWTQYISGELAVVEGAAGRMAALLGWGYLIYLACTQGYIGQEQSPVGGGDCGSSGSALEMDLGSGMVVGAMVGGVIWSATRKAAISICYANTVVLSALTSERAVSLASIDRPQALWESLASLSMRKAV
ncbi:hypothetical protein Tco_0657045 [Tanacetum coccineum]|uniref:PIN-like protein n=1 Tax=Tanacetum coccineum TaxID=301880 RepID=A0ABQ4XAH7_9ASTR